MVVGHVRAFEAKASKVIHGLAAEVVEGPERGRVELKVHAVVPHGGTRRHLHASIAVQNGLGHRRAYVYGHLFIR